MKITDYKNMYKLNKTIYFADDGYAYDNLEEAKENSIYLECVNKLCKQIVYVVDYQDLPEDLKDEYEEYIGQTESDPDETYAVLNKKKDRILMFIDMDTFVDSISRKVFIDPEKRKISWF